jgi:hypothetical protein
MWALTIFASEFGMALIFSLIIYVIWRICNPGQKW